MGKRDVRALDLGDMAAARPPTPQSGEALLRGGPFTASSPSSSIQPNSGTSVRRHSPARGTAGTTPTTNRVRTGKRGVAPRNSAGRSAVEQPPHPSLLADGPDGLARLVHAHGVKPDVAKRRPRAPAVGRSIRASGSDRDDLAAARPRHEHDAGPEAPKRDASGSGPRATAVARERDVVARLLLLPIVAPDDDAVERVAERDREDARRRRAGDDGRRGLGPGRTAIGRPQNAWPERRRPFRSTRSSGPARSGTCRSRRTSRRREAPAVDLLRESATRSCRRPMSGGW